VQSDGVFGRLGLSSSVAASKVSGQRFPDGAHFRVEIPSVENLRVLEAVLSVAMAPSNPAALAVLAELGATTVNIPSDVTIAELAELRAATPLPIDLYVESPDSLGGVVRGNELAELAAVGAPLYAKFGLRNSRHLYPAGDHLVDEAVAIARTKVARAAVALEWARRLDGALVQSRPGAVGLRVPQPVLVSEQPMVTVE
jgi:hypothetical protein